MNISPRNKLHAALATALIASLALAGCKKDADKTEVMTPPAAEQPAVSDPMADTGMTEQTAVNVTSVSLGNEVGDDKKIATPMSTFTTKDDIVVSIDTDGAASSAKIDAKLMFEDGQTAGEESATISPTGAETTNVTFKNANAWPAGNYTVEVWVDGTKAETAKFSVK